MHFFLLALILLFLQNEANSQTIPSKKFTKTNSPIFIADGFVNFSAADSNQSVNFKEESFIGNDSQLFLKSGVMTKDKIKHGAVTKFEFNANSSGVRENPNLDQIFLFSEGSFGKFELGNTQAANQKMKFGPAEFARGAGGINGKYIEALQLPSSGSFILLAQSPIGHGGYALNTNSLSRKNNFRAIKDNSFDGVEDATKLSYFTPRFEGLSLGFSYTPSTKNSGITTTKYYHNSVTTITDVFSTGFSYADDFDNLGVKISTTAEKGRAKKGYGKDLFAYDASATLTYFGFDLGASFGSWKNSLQKAGETPSASSLIANYYSFGLGYSFGPVAASVTSLKSQFQKNDYQALSLGLDYKLTRDLMPYFELTKFSFKPTLDSASSGTETLAKNNQGYVFLTGILISF